MMQRKKLPPDNSSFRAFGLNSKHERKTSAEIVNEAKMMLAEDGVRLVSTRRPITPREPRRQLYGRTGPPDRPPSAFSLRYLQYEGRNLLSSLEPIKPRTPNTCENSEIKSDNIKPSTNNDEKHNNIRKLPAIVNADTKVSQSKPPPLKQSSGSQKKVIPPPIVKIDDKLNENLKKLPQSHSSLSKSKLVRSNDLLTQSSTDMLLEMLKNHNGIKECTEETSVLISGILQEIHTRIKETSGSWRGAVLSALYGLVECNSAKVLLAVAKVILALRVSGSNLTGVCKLIFKVARNENNDSLFTDGDLIELFIDGLARTSPLDEPEACIYGYGAVRFLASGNANNQMTTNHSNNTKQAITLKQTKEKSISKLLGTRLIKCGTFQLMILHLQILNEFGTQNDLKGPPLHALYQLTGALRVLVHFLIEYTTNSVINTSIDVPELYFENEKKQLEIVGPHLVRAAEICLTEIEVQGNIIRTLSILSETDYCSESFIDMTPRIGILLGLREKCGNVPEKPTGYVSRLGYILGNIMAKYDYARISFFQNDVAMEYLLISLEFYTKKKFKGHKDTSKQDDSVTDVLIKLIRVLANMSVNHEVGQSLGSRANLGHSFFSILSGINSLNGVLNSELEELLIATLCALHNICFFQHFQTEQVTTISGSINELQKDCITNLNTILLIGPSVAKPEAARVLGNITRDINARELFSSCNGMKTIIKCLQSDDYELIGTLCGVLVNLLTDWERRSQFKDLMGPEHLRKILETATRKHDWILSRIVCQGLWNFLIDTSNIPAALGEMETDYIQGDLAEYLDEEKIFKLTPPDENWEDFAIVATDLLERIESSISVTNSPNNVSSDEDNLAIKEIGNNWGENFKKWLEE